MNDSLVREVPFDVPAARGLPAWRQELRWPIEHAKFAHVLSEQLHAYLAFVGELPDEDQRNLALLAGPILLAGVRALVQAALCLQAESKNGVRIVSSLAELDYLRGDWNDGVEPPVSASREGPVAVKARLLAARRLVRTLSWTPAWRLPATVLAPTGLVVSHNALLRAAAERSAERLRFHHSEALMANIRAEEGEVPPRVDVPALSEALADVLSRVGGVQEPYLSRLRSLVLARVRPRLARMAGDLACLARSRRVPELLWSGTGGYYPARALGLETLRRGGRAVRFDHCGDSGLMEDMGNIAMTELSVSSKFVVATPDVVARLRAGSALDLVKPFRTVDIISETGDPRFGEMAHLKPRRLRPRPRVIYATVPLRGLRQLPVPLLPDPVYLDWQIRLAGMLAKLPIDFIYKPHPADEIAGTPHPVSAVARTSNAMFEALMDEADIFVFDYPSTTPFWKAVCSDRPVVYIDLGHMRFNSAARPIFERRCRFLRATFNADNLPEIDAEALAEAVLEAANEQPDPTEVRRLLAGVS